MKRAIAGLMLLLTTQFSHAQIPVTDIAHIVENALSWTQQSAEMLEEYNLLMDQYEEMVTQTQWMNDQWDAITNTPGDMDFSSFLNGSGDVSARFYAPATWEDTMQLLESGIDTGSLSDVVSAMENIKATYGVLTSSELLGSNVERTSKMYDDQMSASRGALALSEVSYDRALRRAEDLQDLMEENPDDLKGATDVTNRMLAEVGFIMTDVARLQAVQIQQAGLETQREGIQKTIANEYYSNTSAERAVELADQLDAL